jgi:hypothetical protein
MKILQITILFLGIAISGLAQSKDETAIKAVIEKETQTWLNRDADGQISCFANVPYSTMMVYHGSPGTNGVAFNVKGTADMADGIKKNLAGMGKPTGETFQNKDYVIRINGTSAFCVFEQATTATDGTKGNFHETRYLEKIDGEWKIVYVGAVKF